MTNRSLTVGVPPVRSLSLFPILIFLPMLFAISWFANVSPTTAAVGHDHSDPFEVEGPQLAEPTRWNLPAGAPGLAPEPARLREIRESASELGVANRALPMHRMVSLGLSRNEALSDPDAASRGLATSHPALVGVAERDMELAAVKSARHMTYVHYRQLESGYPVFGSRILFQWDDAARLRLTGSDVFQSTLEGNPTSLRSPEWMPLADARIGALEGMPADLEVTEWEHAEKGWLPLDSSADAGFDLVPVWNIRFRTETPPGWYDAMVEAETGSLISRVNRVVFEQFDARISGLIEPNTIGDFVEEHGFQEAFAKISGPGGTFNLVTDREGNLSADVPAGNYTLETALSGARIVVRDASGGLGEDQLFTPEASMNVSVPADAGDPDANHLLWDGATSIESHRDAYYHGNLAYAAVRAIDDTPGISELDQPMQTVVEDVSGQCNAYWNGTKMNFYAAGGGCAATARIADVVYHEYGHAVTQFTYEPFFAPLDMHEGFSDYLAATMRDDPLIGRGFRGPGTSIRDLEEHLVYPDDVDSDPHRTGLIIAGALWDLRKEIGKEKTDELWHFARYAGAITFDDFLIDMLVLDDTDADLSNGTPNMDAIVRNFRDHGIGDYAVALSFYELPDVEDPGTTLRVATRVWSLLPVQASGSAFFYSVGQADNFVRADLQQGVAGEWFADIPSPPDGSTVYYYWTVANNAGDVTIVPDNAPANALSFFVGEDLVAPSISHFEPTALANDAKRLYLRAEVEDNSQQLTSVNVEYSVPGGPEGIVPMERLGDGNTYGVTIDLGDGGLAGDIRYSIVATDRSAAANTTSYPADGSVELSVRQGWWTDLEDDDAGMRWTNDWQWGETFVGSWSGSKVWGTQLDGRYSDSSTSSLTWGPFDLRTFDRARLQFHHIYRFERAFDGGLIEIKEVGGDRWSPIDPAGGYPGNVVALNRDGFTDVLDDWEEVVVPLDSWLGKEIEVRFRMASDVFVSDLGWFLDDLMLLEAQALIDPRDVGIEDGMDRRIEISWRPPLGVDLNSDRWTGFRLYRREAGGEEVSLTGSEPVLDFGYVDTEVDNGVEYNYRVVSVYDEGESRGVELQGAPFAATVGLSVESIGMVVTGYGSVNRSFQVENTGSGTLRFNTYVAEPGADLSSVVARTQLTGTAGDPVTIVQDDADGTDVVDIAAVSVQEIDVNGVPWISFIIEGHGWANPQSDWGGFLTIDTDNDLSTSQGDFATPWGETYNAGYEYGLIFGNLPPQVGLPEFVLGYFFSADQTFGEVLTAVDFPTDGSPITFAFPKTWIGNAVDIQIGLVVGPSFGLPAADSTPDIPSSASWLERSPKNGVATQSVKQTVTVVFDNDDLPSGTYSTDMILASNDPLNPEVRLPISIQIDRTAPPPDLATQIALPSIAGMNVRFVPRPSLAVVDARIEKEESHETWVEIAGPLTADAGGAYSFLDRDVVQGQTYRYRFPLEFEGGASQTYGPLEAVFEPTAPALSSSSTESTTQGLSVSFQLAPELSIVSADFLRRVKPNGGEDTEYQKIVQDVPAGAENVVSIVDQTVKAGVDYQYKVEVRTDEGVGLVYGPVEGRYESLFPAELPDLLIGSTDDGLDFSFFLPEIFNPLVGVWLDRREVGGDWVALLEEPLIPDTEGRIHYFDPWATPFNQGVEPDQDYEYRIRVEIEGREVDYFEPARFAPPMPQEVRLYAPRPNPFRNQVVIRMDLPTPQRVKLEVYDVSGRRRAVIENREMSAGAHQMVWDGRDDLGEDLGSGVYWMRMDAGSKTETTRILRTR